MFYATETRLYELDGGKDSGVITWRPMTGREWQVSAAVISVDYADEMIYWINKSDQVRELVYHELLSQNSLKTVMK